MFQLIVIVTILVALSLLMLGINIFVFKRKFPETEIGRNRHMIGLGLRCPKCEENKAYRKKLRPSELNVKRLKPDWTGLEQ